MKLIHYLFKNCKFLIYLILAVCISFISNIMMQKAFSILPKLVAPVFLILFILRTNDDIKDYEKDKGNKTQYLSKKELISLYIFLSFLLVAINLCIYPIHGFLSILIIGYMPLLEKAAPFKLFFGAFLFILYAWLNEVSSLNHYVVGTSVFLVLSTIFYVMKTRKSYD